MMDRESHYRERVYAPWWIWLLSLALCGSFAVAFGAALGSPIGIATFLAMGLLIAWGLVSSAYVISIDGENIKVGKAHLPLRYCGKATALDPGQTRERRGPTADPACYLMMRGWISTAVTIEVTDPLDPTPYWFISSRSPALLVEALAAAKTG